MPGYTDFLQFQDTSFCPDARIDLPGYLPGYYPPARYQGPEKHVNVKFFGPEPFCWQCASWPFPSPAGSSRDGSKGADPSSGSYASRPPHSRTKIKERASLQACLCRCRAQLQILQVVAKTWFGEAGPNLGVGDPFLGVCPFIQR